MFHYNILILCLSFFISVESVMVKISDQTKNWTNCKEFLRDADFSVGGLVNYTWTMFYYWSMQDEPKIDITFRYVKEQVVSRFKSILEYSLMKPVDWSKAELYIWSETDILGMLFSTRRKGVYKMIPALPVHDSRFQDTKVDPRTLAMKFVDNYLVTLVCETKYAYAFSKKGELPDKKQTNIITKKINMKSDGKSIYYVTENPFDIASFDTDLGLKID